MDTDDGADDTHAEIDDHTDDVDDGADNGADDTDDHSDDVDDGADDGADDTDEGMDDHPNNEQTEESKVPLNFSCCSSKSFVEYLLKNRFNENTLECKKFLLECAEELSELNLQENGIVSQETLPQIGEILESIEGVSCIQPRGKFKITIHSKGLSLLSNKGEALSVSSKQVQKIIRFPKPEDLMMKKKDNVCYMILSLSSNLCFKKKELNQLCFPYNNKTTSYLQESLKIAPEEIIEITKGGQKSSFKSESSIYPNMPFLQCYSGVNLGVLFPHVEGLVFFKPPFFLPRKQLSSIECGRGSGVSRYIDMTIMVEEQDQNERQMQFTNIPREELKPLKKYIDKLISCMKKDINHDTVDKTENCSTQNKSLRTASISSENVTRQEILAQSEGSDEDDSDEDYDVSSSSDSEDSRIMRRSSTGTVTDDSDSGKEETVPMNESSDEETDEENVYEPPRKISKKK